MEHGSIMQETETGSLRSVKMTLSQTRAAQRSHFSIFRRNATHLENSSCTGSRLDYPKLRNCHVGSRHCLSIAFVNGSEAWYGINETGHDTTMQLIKLSITTILLVFAVLTVMADATQLRRTKSEKSSKGSGTKGGHGGRHRRHSTKDCGEPRKPHKHGKYDLGIRFNKFKMTDDYIGFPVKLDWRNFPLDEDMAYKLSHYSTVQSLVMPDDYEVKEVCIEHYIDAVGGYPVFPERNPDSPFWQELQEVVNAQKMRIQGRIPSFFVLPDTWKGYTADQVADAVHNEYPGFNHIFLIESLFAEGLEIDHTCTPFRSKYDFIGEQVRLSTLNTWSVGVVSAVNFAVKFYVGQPRPEVRIDRFRMRYGIAERTQTHKNVLRSVCCRKLLG